MVEKCVVFGCSNSRNKEKVISMHTIPSDLRSHYTFNASCFRMVPFSYVTAKKIFFENECLKDMEIYQKKNNQRVRGTLNGSVSPSICKLINHPYNIYGTCIDYWKVIERSKEAIL